MHWNLNVLSTALLMKCLTDFAAHSNPRLYAVTERMTAVFRTFGEYVRLFTTNYIIYVCLHFPTVYNKASKPLHGHVQSIFIAELGTWHNVNERRKLW